MQRYFWYKNVNLQKDCNIVTAISPPFQHLLYLFHRDFPKAMSNETRQYIYHLIGVGLFPGCDILKLVTFILDMKFVSY